MTLTAHERAELLGVSLAEYGRLASIDTRIVAAETLTAPAWRAWREAGQPDADLSTLVAYVSDRVRSLLIEMLATLPMPARWWSTHVLWLAIGDGVAGQMRVAPGDIRHVIVLDDRLPDDLLRRVMVHELAHAVHSGVNVARPERQDTHQEHAAFVLVAAMIHGRDEHATIERMDAVEVEVNATAARWGWPSHNLCSDEERRRKLRDQLHAARGRAAEIAADLGYPNAIDIRDAG